MINDQPIPEHVNYYLEFSSSSGDIVTTKPDPEHLLDPLYVKTENPSNQQPRSIWRKNSQNAHSNPKQTTAVLGNAMRATSFKDANNSKNNVKRNYRDKECVM